MNLSEQATQPLSQEYRTIPLSQGQFAIVDVEDYEWLNQWKWTAWWSSKTRSFYAVRNEYITRKNVKRIIMSRQILNCPKGMIADHKNHDTLNNRRYNLRIATTSQNTCNSGKRRNNTSGFKGVMLHPATGKWRARIKKNYKTIDLGCFKTPEEAHEAYKLAAKDLHGEFASW